MRIGLLYFSLLLRFVQLELKATRSTAMPRAFSFALILLCILIGPFLVANQRLPETISCLFCLVWALLSLRSRP